MIEIINVTKKFGNKTIIEDMNLEVEDGKIFGFIGPNGSGKTTTINMMTGITRITEGDIFINGKSIVSDNLEAKKEFGLVPDSPDMFLDMKVINYFNFVADVYGVSKEDRKERIEKLCKEFEIEQYMKDEIETLSHGTRQKVMIIAVLIHNPKTWILDEPMTGLDPNASFVLKEKMKKHAKEGNAVFFSTHVLEVAEKLCDIIAIIKEGKIIYKGTYEELKAKYPETEDLEELFILITKGGKNA